MSRPEHIAPAEVFYDAPEAAKYGANSRMIRIQTAMTERALELAKIQPDSGKAVLDIGCGSGISGEVLSDHGHYWVGLDISPSMLLVALERDCEGDLMLSDIGQGFKFRPGVFDAAISISAVQWLCRRNKTSDQPFKRAYRFFQSVFNSLVQGGRAVFQFYPEGPDQIELLTSAAMKAGFTGGLVVDFPHSAKAKKYFLVLNCGATVDGGSNDVSGLAKTGNGEDMEESDEDAMEDGSEEGSDAEDGEGNRKTIKVEKRVTEEKKKRKNQRGKVSVKTIGWIKHKKQQMRAQGREVKKDSKFTGRKRAKPRF